MMIHAKDLPARSTGRDGEAPPVQEAGSFDVEALRNKINDESYLAGAIQRIALILSNELLNIPQRGFFYERQRKRR
jgi:hypothetical protein